MLRAAGLSLPSDYPLPLRHATQDAVTVRKDEVVGMKQDGLMEESGISHGLAEGESMSVWHGYSADRCLVTGPKLTLQVNIITESML